MTLRMVGLVRAKNGGFVARKDIPLTRALRFRVSSECARKPQLKLPTNTPRHEAKTRLAEWAVEVETGGSANDGDYQKLRPCSRAGTQTNSSF